MMSQMAMFMIRSFRFDDQGGRFGPKCATLLPSFAPRFRCLRRTTPAVRVSGRLPPWLLFQATGRTKL
jgi:hypothetical protein